MEPAGILQLSRRHLAELFGKMSIAGGLFGAEPIQWFNGGLFDGPDALPLDLI